MVNSRPIAKNTGDPETGGPITPLHLQLGRATVEVPSVKFQEAPRLTQRLQFIEEAKKQFWKKWMQQVFSGRMLNHKWVKTVRNVAVGDIVYLAEAENDDPTYRLGMVVVANPGEDGCVRTVRVQYTNPGKSDEKRSPPKTTTRPIHKVALIVPAEYVFEDDVCDNEVGPRGRKRDLKMKGEPEAAEAPGRSPAKAAVKEPKAGGAQPAGRRRRGRPKRSERPAAVGEGLGEEPRPTGREKPSEPQAESQNGPNMGADAAATPEAEDQPPALRRGRSRDLGPRGQQDRGQSC
jgi:hypothetical protein